ncbi:hypothetical protein ACFWNN_28110 [Lentzea sp. NPDC058450]|uniref:hypothetical protein n=1 Tax=Lentzea sp. NPDC058450 TaxID=3346505 RepID=UPI0036570ED3
MNERAGGDPDYDDFELTDELRSQIARVEEPILISEGVPDASVPTNPPRLGGFRPSEPNE